MVNVEGTLAMFFEQLQGLECCDQCAVDQIINQGADHIHLMDIRESAWVLAESSCFHRSMGKCAFCKQVKIVTRVC